ncbi:MAG: hypothetical protein ACHP7H_01495 [Hyphomicrobiales bacterium]
MAKRKPTKADRVRDTLAQFFDEPSARFDHRAFLDYAERGIGRKLTAAEHGDLSKLAAAYVRERVRSVLAQA